jgi:hypothetical protein
VDDADLAVRNATYGLLVELGRAPAVEEVAAGLGGTETDVRAAWRRLHDEHALVLDGEGGLRMLSPFSAIATPFRVQAAGRSWYANCGWDAFGICAALDVDGRIETECADCGEPIAIEVVDGAPDDGTFLFHCLVPASRWWDDIVFT